MGLSSAKNLSIRLNISICLTTLKSKGRKCQTHIMIAIAEIAISCCDSIVSVAVIGTVFNDGGFNIHILSFLILPLLLSSFLLSFRDTWLCMLLQIAAVVLIASQQPDVGRNEILFASIRFQLFVGIFILL